MLPVAAPTTLSVTGTRLDEHDITYERRANLRIPQRLMVDTAQKSFLTGT